MFSGIIECIGRVEDIVPDRDNLTFTIKAEFASELKIDQSVAHNGICLTVIKIQDDCYDVTAIAETLKVTNLGLLKKGSAVNLERCLRIGDRLDGHIVQGHVDTTAKVTGITEKNGSWIFEFELTDCENASLLIRKGSVTVNGISLTVVNNSDGRFSVAIIPYTIQHTNFSTLTEGDQVNIEFDVIGKYVENLMKYRNMV